MRSFWQTCSTSTDSCEERVCAVVQGERVRQGVWKLPGNQVKERVIDSRIRNEVTIAEQQFGFMPGRSTPHAIFCLRVLMEKWSEAQKAVHCVFIDLDIIEQDFPNFFARDPF